MSLQLGVLSLVRVSHVTAVTPIHTMLHHQYPKLLAAIRTVARGGSLDVFGVVFDAVVLWGKLGDRSLASSRVLFL